MNQAARTFRSIARSFLRDRNELFPQEASELGLSQYDPLLGRNDRGFHEDYRERLQVTLARIEALPDGGFSSDDWIDRRAMLAMLRTSLLEHGSLERWRNNPQIHCDAAIQSVFGLIVRNTGNLRKALPAVESRLEKIPQFLREGSAVLRKPVPLWTSLACRTCEGAVHFLKGIEPALLAVSAKQGQTLAALEGACAAFKAYAAAAKRKSPGPANGFCVGRDNFEMLIRERLGMDYSLPEVQALGKDLVGSLTADVTAEATRLAKKKGRPAAASVLLEDAAAAWQPSSTSLVEEYRHVTASVRERFRSADLLTLPENERLDVLLVPEFLQHQFPTAAYHQPGPFARKQHGIFWVNDLSRRVSGTAAQAAEIRQHFGLELTCAHEGYPGHHVQFVMQNRHPSHLRRQFAHAIYYEGWTLWCEKLCIEHGIWESPWARLVQLNDALWRAWRIVIDCGLHSGELSFRQACAKLVEGAGFTLSRARGDVNWYTSAPTVPMSYLLGRLELEKLYGEKVVGEKWTVRKFNDWVLSFGAVPWEWIRRSERLSHPD